MEWPTLFDQTAESGEELRDIGIKQAEDHANEVFVCWSEKAFEYIRYFAHNYDHETFMAEDIRKSSIGIIDQPPSARAWGAIILRARKEGLISQVGYGKVSNPKAHCANAAIYRSNRRQ